MSKNKEWNWKQWLAYFVGMILLGAGMFLAIWLATAPEQWYAGDSNYEKLIEEAK